MHLLVWKERVMEHLRQAVYVEKIYIYYNIEMILNATSSNCGFPQQSHAHGNRLWAVNTPVEAIGNKFKPHWIHSI